MAKTENILFKGFKQIFATSGQTPKFENGYLYFVRTSADKTDKTDGYLYLNGKKYGTAEEAKALIEQVGAIVGSGFTDSSITNEIKKLISTVEGLEGKAHEHGNKELLDTYTQTEANLADAVAKKHGHDNKTVLDGITSDKVTAWDDAEQNAKAYADKVVSSATTRITELETKSHTHTNAAVLSGITSDKVSKWDKAATDDHTHTNKTVLDGITAEKVTAWDAAEANVQADWAVTDTTSDAYIKNKPTDLVKDSLTIAGVDLKDNITKKELLTALNVADGAEVNVQADWNEKNTASDAYIKNKPENLVQDANYVHTDNNYTTAEKNKLSGIEAGAQVNVIESISVNGVTATIDENKKATVTISEATKTTSGVMSSADKSKLDGIAAGAEVNYIKSVGDNLAVDAKGKLTVNIPSAEVTGVAETSVNGLKLELKDKKVTLVDVGLANTLTSKDVTVRKKSDTTDDQCVYEILQGETVVGTINHPKDMVVTGGEVIVASTEEGLTQGEKYLKLTIANQEKPVYIAVKDLVDVYAAGNGIEISNKNVVGVKINNGDSGVKLSADANGLQASIMIYDEDAD